MKIPLVLLHGWGTHAEVWSPLTELLSRDFEVVAPDWRPNPDGSLPGPADLGDMPERAIWAGWSLGAALAVEIARRAPQRALGVVTVAFNPSFVQRRDWRFGMPRARFSAFCEQYATTPWQTLHQFQALLVHDEPLAARRQMRALLGEKPVLTEGLEWLDRLDLRPALSALSAQDVPFLHICGGLDPLVPRAIAPRFPPQQRVLLLERAAHAPMLSQPHSMAAALSGFVDDYLRNRELSLPAPHRVAASFSGAAPTYRKAAALQRKTARELCAEVSAEPGGLALDLGSGLGAVAGALAKRGARRVIAADISLEMLRHASEVAPKVCADMRALPFRDAGFRLLASNMAAQWCDPDSFLGEAWRLLERGGECVFTVPTADTLCEFKWAWRMAGAADRVHRFASLKVWREACERRGFEVISCASDRHVRWHAQMRDLVLELKRTGAAVAAGDAPPATPAAWRAAGAAYEELRSAAGELPATWQIATLRLRKP